ncbi:hypothetical protein ACFYTQ_13750 [Nocardia sp. NPDC004068]|uniref:hypothetical protein n=1 Tax=Nocardia sp. NPDC004068 TaxID=3364303 RepID=UPI0036A4028C
MKDLADPDVDPRTLLLAAEEAEAAAEAAEAEAAAARARARAARLRQRAEASARTTETSTPATEPSVPVSPTPPEPTGSEEHPTPEAARDASKPTVAEADSAAEAEARADIEGAGESVAGEADSEERTRLRRVRARVAAVGWRRGAVVTVAVVLIVVSLGVSGFSVWRHREADAEQRRAAEFTAAARQGVVALTSLDFNHAKDDVQRVLDNSTGAFRDDFQGRADDFTKVVQQSQVTTEGKVTATAVESMTDDSAVILVAATSQITNSAGAKQEPRVWRLSVTVTRADDRIKMSKVEFVP